MAQENRNTPPTPPMGFRGGRGPGGPHAAMFEQPKLKNGKQTIFRILGYLGTSKFMLMFVLFLSVVTAAVTILGTRLSGIAIDEFIAEKNIVGLLKLCGILAFVYVIGILSTYIQNIKMVEIAQHTTSNLRKDLFSNFTKLPVKYFDNHSSGDLMSRLTNDVDNISLALSQNTTQLFSGVVSIIGTLIAMILLNPFLTLLSLITIPLTLFSAKFIVKHARKYFKEQQQNLGEINGFVEEKISGQKIINLFSKENDTIKDFEEINNRFYKSAFKAQIVSGVMGPTMNMINNISYLLVAVTGGIMAVKYGNSDAVKFLAVTPGVIYSFLIYMKNIGRPINEISNLYNTIQSALAGAQRVFEVMDEEKEMDNENAVNLENCNGNVEFKDVTFSYVEGKKVLKNADISGKSGEQIAIVGPTGAGKTTIISLLTRFYDLDSGEITIDGRNIIEFKRNSLRKMIGMVLQDTYIFSETVKDNIRYACPNATDEEVIEAAKLANAHSFIKHLPQGYDTVLSDNGSDISQGQRQLIAIARIALADPQILILDEATSSIDTRTELKVQEALLKLMGSKTSFIIAHRLSTIKNADKILVLKDGEIIETGNHKELLQKDGFYAYLYNSQFKKGMSI